MATWNRNGVAQSSTNTKGQITVASSNDAIIRLETNTDSASDDAVIELVTDADGTPREGRIGIDYSDNTLKLIHGATFSGDSDGDLVDNQIVGDLVWQGYNNSKSSGAGYDNMALIRGRVDGTPDGSDDDMPGELAFYTTADDGTLAQRMTIRAAGGVETTGTVNGASATEMGYLSGVSSAIQTQLNSKQATLTYGRSSGNALKISAAAQPSDGDLLIANGTDVSGRAIGIANDNIVEMDDADAANNDYAKFTANGLSGRSYAEVLSDIGAQAALTFGIGNTNIPIFTSGVADDDFLRVNGTSIEGRSAAEVLSDIGAEASLTFGIANNNAVDIDAADVAEDDYAQFTADGLQGRSATEVKTDLSLSNVTNHAQLPLAGGTMTGDINMGANAVGFTQFEPTYNASDTEVHFDDNGNKAFATFGAGNITDLNLYFPDFSCNCVLLLKQDGSGSRTVTNFKTFDQADGNESTVQFAGGSNPTLTTAANKIDIISFYWDNDNHKAYGTITKNF